MQRVLDDVGQRAREQRAVDGDDWQVRVRLHLDRDSVRKAAAIRLDHFLNQCGQRRRLGPRRGRRREAGELRRDLTEQLDLRQDRGDALVEDRGERAAAIDVDPLGVLGRELNGSQRVLDVVRHLARHVGPRLEALRPLQLATLALEVGRHLVEVLDQPPQFVGRSGGHARVEVAAGDASGRPREAIHRVGDPLGHPVSERGAEQAEQHEAAEHAAIELVDLLFDLLLPVRHRYSDDQFPAARAHRRGRELVRQIADLFQADEGRQPIEQDRAIDVARRARRQHLRGKEIPGAGRLQARPVEQVHVLVDRAAHQHQDLIVDRVERRGAPLLQRRVVLDQALRRGHGTGRGLGRAVEQLRRHVGSDENGEDEYGDDRAGPEGQEQLPVEAGSNFAKERAAARGRSHAERAEQGEAGEHRHVQDHRQHHQFREVDQVPHPADHGIAERVDAATIAPEIDAERLVVAIERAPERFARLDETLEDGIGECPDAGTRLEDRRATPPVDNELDVPPRDALGRDLAIGTQRLEIRALRRDEGQCPIVEHHAHDEAANHAAADADASGDAQHVPLAGSKRGNLVERLVPTAARRSIFGRGIFRQAEPERADQAAVGAVQLDGRRQAVGGKIGARPDGKGARGIGHRRRHIEPDQLVERRDHVDLIHRLLKPLLQVLAQARRLRAERCRNQSLFGFGRVGEQRRIHRDRRHQQCEEEHGEPGGLRDPAHPAVDACEGQRAQAGHEERDPHRADRHGRAGDPRERGHDDRPREPAARGGQAPQPAARRAQQRRRQPDGGGRAPDHGGVQQHEREFDGQPLAAERMQREMQQVQVRVGDDPPQQSLVAPQQRRGRESREEERRRQGGARDGGRRQQPDPRPREPPPLDDVEDEPDDGRHRERRQQQIERRRLLRLGERGEGDKQHGAGADRERDQQGGHPEKAAEVACLAPQIQQRPGAQQQRDGQDAQRCGPRHGAPAGARSRQFAGRHVGFEHKAAVAPGQSEPEWLRRRRAAGADAQGDGRDRRRHRERFGEARRAARGAERLLDDDGGDAEAAACDRLDADETRPERSRSHDQRLCADYDFLRQFGGAAIPRQRHPQRVVDGDAGPPRFIVWHGGRDDVEEAFEAGLIAGCRAHGVRLRGDPLGDRAERGRAGVEALPQFGLDATERRLVRRTETRPLETIAD